METKITDKNFEEEVLNSSKPVILDFWASWCGPCMMMGPVFEELSNEIDNVKFGKVNVDENEGLSQKFGIMSIPCFVLVKDGKVAAQTVGACPKDKLKSFIQGNM